MMFSAQHNSNLEEEEEEDAEIDDALLGELEGDEALLDEEVDPLVKETIDPLLPSSEDDVAAEGKVFEEVDDDEDEDLDYDSFDDRDEM